MTERKHKVLKQAGRWFVILLVPGMLAGCGTYVPKDSMVVEIKNSKREFDRAKLVFIGNEISRSKPVNMKWYDTNTFITSGTLAPGVYEFRARNFNGSALTREILIKEGTDLYEVDLKVSEKDAEKAVATGPVVKGHIQAGSYGRQITNVSVLFIGRDIVLKSAEVSRNGSFEVNAPSEGNWKIEVHLLGNNPLSYIRPTTQIKGPLNLGEISLR